MVVVGGGGGLLGSGRYRLKNRFFLVIIIEAPISIKNGTNILRNALFSDLKFRNSHCLR